MGYRSRAAFKLLELEARFKFFKTGARVVDLGAAPGSWSQVAAERVVSREDLPLVVAADLTLVQPMQGVRFVHGDVTTQATVERVAAELDFKKADVVVSDMAPEFTGDRFIDHTESFRLSRSCLEASISLLRKGGVLVVKVHQGPLEEHLFVGKSFM